MRVLVTGASGTLGRVCLSTLREAGHEVIGTHCRRSVDPALEMVPLDVRDRRQVDQLVDRIDPAAIIHTAYAQHDWTTTATGTAHVAVAAARRGARLVALSSDAVFGGRAEPYPESAPPSPSTPYGAAKAAAEAAVAAVAPGAAIVRTSLIIGDVGATGHERHVHQAVADPGGHVFFTDDVKCPVHVADLARALSEIAESSRAGIHHVAGADALTRYELAVLIAQRDALDSSVLRSGLRQESGLSAGTTVRLDCRRTQAALSTRLRGAREFLRREAAPDCAPRAPRTHAPAPGSTPRPGHSDGGTVRGTQTAR